MHLGRKEREDMTSSDFESPGGVCLRLRQGSHNNGSGERLGSPRMQTGRAYPDPFTEANYEPTAKERYNSWTTFVRWEGLPAKRRDLTNAPTKMPQSLVTV